MVRAALSSHWGPHGTQCGRESRSDGQGGPAGREQVLEWGRAGFVSQPCNFLPAVLWGHWAPVPDTQSSHLYNGQLTEPIAEMKMRGVSVCNAFVLLHCEATKHSGREAVESGGPRLESCPFHLYAQSPWVTSGTSLHHLEPKYSYLGIIIEAPTLGGCDHFIR